MAAANVSSRMRLAKELTTLFEKNTFRLRKENIVRIIKF
jgi:hypothetical protein